MDVIAEDQKRTNGLSGDIKHIADSVEGSPQMKKKKTDEVGILFQLVYLPPRRGPSPVCFMDGCKYSYGTSPILSDKRDA